MSTKEEPQSSEEEETPIRSNAPKFSTLTFKKVRVTCRA